MNGFKLMTDDNVSDVLRENDIIQWVCVNIIDIL